MKFVVVVGLGTRNSHWSDLDLDPDPGTECVCILFSIAKIPGMHACILRILTIMCHVCAWGFTPQA